jgi:hypothetical protein
MSTFFGVLRKRMLAPSLASVGFEERGFPVTPTTATARLEAVPQAVVCGFEWAVEGASLWELERRLALVEPEQRGFAYEGATMGYTILDAMPGGGRDRTKALLEGPGEPHIFLTYIGIGFAMARLPRPLWKNILPELDGVHHHPIMSWLAVDGFGFDRAYFDTRKWVDEQAEPAPYPWAGRADYFSRAFDQGVGLAATFAGGTDQAGLETLRRLSGAHHAELALGVVFAVKARTYSTYVPDHSRLAAGVLAGLTVEAAESLADRTEVPFEDAGPVPPYERWRARIRAEFGAESLREAS